MPELREVPPFKIDLLGGFMTVEIRGRYSEALDDLRVWADGPAQSDIIEHLLKAARTR